MDVTLHVDQHGRGAVRIPVTQRVHAGFDRRRPTLAFRFAMIIKGDRWRIHVALVDDVSFSVAVPCMRIDQAAGSGDPPVLGEVITVLRTDRIARLPLTLSRHQRKPDNGGRNEWNSRFRMSLLHGFSLSTWGCLSL